MARYARLSGDIVAEIITLPDDLAPSDAYHPEVASQCRPCGEEVGERWRFDGVGFAPPQEPGVDPIAVKEALKAHAVAKHADTERSGYGWNGHVIMTDPESQLKLATERLAVVTGDRADGEIWIMAGGPVPLTNTEISEMATAVRAWVKDLYAIRTVLIDRINLGTITSTAEIDAAFLEGAPVQT